MPRFFIEVSYTGKNYGGFQRQDNANTIQSEVENALQVYLRSNFALTGSSRTDAGVHAKQNFFHFDSEALTAGTDFRKVAYHLNAILPADIAVNGLFPVAADAHCRFDAISRSYQYTIYREKNPFLGETGYYYPFRLDQEALINCAREFLAHNYYEAFSKKKRPGFHLQLRDLQQRVDSAARPFGVRCHSQSFSARDGKRNGRYYA